MDNLEHNNSIGSIPLTEKYRPRYLRDIRGQDWVVQSLQSFVRSPHASAFLFNGETGTGKTSTALALANELGIAIDQGEFGGLFQIPSGEQTGEAVRRLIRNLHSRPFSGSGWNMLIVNEADFMTANAAQVWLDVLEHIPSQAVIIFTTNDAGKLPRRFRTRCECITFESSAMFLTPILQTYINEIWLAETGRTGAPRVSDLEDVIDSNGNLSFRQALQSLSQIIRAGGRAPRQSSMPAKTPLKSKRKPQSDLEDIDALVALADRWKAGEKLADLARLVGLSWQQLIGAFWSNNIVERGYKASHH